MKDVLIRTDEIKLDQFLKWANLVNSGGEAKVMIQAGKVRINGEVNTRRGSKISTGDVVMIEGEDEIFRVIRE